MRPRSRSRRGPLALGLLALGLLAGCPGKQEPPAEQAPPVAVTTPATPATPAMPGPEFAAEAHRQALGRLRQEALPALRRLDPVAAAEVEGAPLRPPAFGPAERAALRNEVDAAQREAGEIRAMLLSPEEGMVLRTVQQGLERGRARVRLAPWRDDPSALVDALVPYQEALPRWIAAGRCEDGCGLAELGPALRAGLAEVGAASEPTLAATREDLASLRESLPRWTRGLDPEHPLMRARSELETTLVELDAELQRAAAAVASAPERGWEEPLAPADPGAWQRRPVRWSADKLRGVMEDQEALGIEAKRLFDRAELTTRRLHAMIDRDAAQPSHTPALPRPFDASACEATWAPLQAWAELKAPQLAPVLDCASALRDLPAGGPGPGPTPSDAAIVLHLVDVGFVEPSRRAQITATGIDIALVRGRAAPLAQRLTLQIAITAGSGQREAELHALRQAHARACLAATAVWIHGELGDLDTLRPRFEALGCEDLEARVVEAEARPRAALHGLGFVLLGRGPADAVALDRFWWSPMGLVYDLALPPPPSVETPPPMHIEELTPGE